MKPRKNDPSRPPMTRRELIAMARLTTREAQALDLLAKFLTNKAIADQLGISRPAAKKILHSAYLKLGVQSRSEASALWRETKP